MTQQIKKILAMILLICLLTSCDKEHTKDFYIQNEMDREILVEFLIAGVSDSTIVDVKSTQLIYSDIYYYGKVGVSDDRDNDNISDITIKFDSTEKMINEEFWDYVDQGKYQANYIIKIDSSIIK